jgi:diaminohydroxyphosphoribosylaminopyrimidine deaminase/5-amino-6-(5-phosphoribosylamino)uracil reductase
MHPNSPADDSGQHWPVLLAAAALSRNPRQWPRAEAGFACVAGRFQPVDSHAAATLRWRPSAGWCCGDGLDAAARDFLELYLPLCQPLATGFWVVAHLGQSLDGCIATHSGDSEHVTGAANIRHLHRMRALSDAVIVGAGTVASDDPRLTTRLVPGPNAVRVVLDPAGRLGVDYRLFTDGAAPTLWCRRGAGSAQVRGRAELLELADDDCDLRAMLNALARRGLRRLFIEGGGVTVSDCLAAGLLDRLQIAVAPVMIGGGRAGVTLPRSDAMAQALRPKVRIYRMGSDVLYDFDLSVACGAESSETDSAGVDIRRLL